MKKGDISIRKARKDDAEFIAQVVAMAIGDEVALHNYCGDNYISVLTDIVLPMIILIINYVIIRQTYLAIATHFTSDVRFVFMAWPLTWITNALMMGYCYFKTDLRKI